MIMLIVAAAAFLNFVLSAIGLVNALNGLITGLGFGPYETLFAVIAFYVVLGCFMEPLLMMIVTVPVISPSSSAPGSTRSGSASLLSCCARRR